MVHKLFMKFSIDFLDAQKAFNKPFGPDMSGLIGGTR